MSSSQFVLAYACDREDAMSLLELDYRLDEATRHLENVAGTALERATAGDGRTGLVVWQHTRPRNSWPMFSTRDGEAAAWLHIPSVAGGIDDASDPIDLARGLTNGAVDRVGMGAPCAAFHWSKTGLSIVNDRLGMVRLYQFTVPGFGHVWSSRPGLAHVFGGLSPELAQSTWSDMATLGWPADGSAHLGNGHQLSASTVVSASDDGKAMISSDRDEWMTSSLDGDVPSLAEGARGMVRSLSVASWWAGKPIADLSGGKDSRVTAAAAISAGIVDTVRTVNTDTGEVDTARALLRLAGDPVEHRVDSVLEPAPPEGGVFNRYLSMQRAWEGAYNARSAYRSRAFTGFRPASAPRINGLGGEAVQGRTTVSPAWRAKMEGQGPDAGRERLAQMVRSGAGGVTEAGIEDSIESVDRFVGSAQQSGMSTAFMVIDYFYHFSKMPYWSLPQGTGSTLLPFYSPQMLPRTMWSLANASEEYGSLHREILREILPGWADVPFYKGSAITRATPWMWENSDWNELSSTIRDGVHSSATFSPQAVGQLLEEAEAGAGNVRHELAFTRVMWELSFREYMNDIARAAEQTAKGVQRIRRSQ